MATDRPPHPPAPGGVVTPNLSAVMEAVGNVTFPISKRELMDTLGESTVLFNGKNVDLHDLVRDLNDDYFESESEFRVALEDQYAGLLLEDLDLDPVPLPTGAQRDWQTDVGPGTLAGARDHLEPHG